MQGNRHGQMSRLSLNAGGLPLYLPARRLPPRGQAWGPIHRDQFTGWAAVDSHTMHQAGRLHVILTDAEGALFSKGSLHFKVTAGKVI